MLARLFWLAVLFAGSAHAACTAPLRAGISELGYSGYRDNGQLRGAAVDILREAARRVGCTVEFQLFPRSRLFVQFDAFQLDLAASAAQSPERDRTGHFIPYAETQFELIASDSRSYARLADFVDQSSGHLNSVRGAWYAPEVMRQFDRLRAAGRLEEVADFDTAFKKMAVGRADAILAPEMVHARLLRENRIDGIVSVSAVAESPPMAVGMYLSRQTVSVQMRKRLQAAIDAMRRDGAIAAVYRRYLGKPPRRSGMPGPEG